MKKLIILCISSMVIAASSSFKVEGMMCGVSCVNKIKTQVDALEGVKSCDVSFEKGMMIVNYDNSKLNDEQIIKLLADNTTYKVTTLESEANHSSSNCQKSCCANKEGKVGFFKRLFSWF